MADTQLARETLIDGADYIEKVIFTIDNIVENLLAGQENVALQGFQELVDGLEWIINVVILTRPAQEEIGIKMTDPAGFMSSLNEIIEAFENTDYVLLGDLLNYEAKPILEQWSRELKSIKEKLISS